MRLKSSLRACVAGCVLLSAGVGAQELPDLSEPALGQATAPGTGPNQTPNVEVPEKTLKVTRFTLEGDASTQPEGVAALLSSYEGQNLSLTQMKEVAKQITALYREKGFLLTWRELEGAFEMSRRSGYQVTLERRLDGTEWIAELPAVGVVMIRPQDVIWLGETALHLSVAESQE